MSKRRATKTLAEPIITETPGQVEQTEPETETVEVDVTPEFVEPEEAAQVMAMAAYAETRYGVIQNARYVNVREEPSPVANVLRVANEGERLIILYEENGFYKVEFEDKTQGFIAKEFVKELDPEEEPDLWLSKTESILTSVKKLLGIDESCEDFDLDVMIAINSAIFTLSQLGIGPEEGFSIANKNATYADYLGEKSAKLYGPVKMYLYYKVKLGWDTPTSGIVTGIIEKQIQELEWRLNVAVDPEKETEETPDEEG